MIFMFSQKTPQTQWASNLTKRGRNKLNQQTVSKRMKLERIEEYSSWWIAINPICFLLCMMLFVSSIRQGKDDEIEMMYVGSGLVWCLNGSNNKKRVEIDGKLFHLKFWMFHEFWVLWLYQVDFFYSFKFESSWKRKIRTEKTFNSTHKESSSESLFSQFLFYLFFLSFILLPKKTNFPQVIFRVFKMMCLRSYNIAKFNIEKFTQKCHFWALWWII